MLIRHLLPSNQDFYVGTCHIFALLMKSISISWQWVEIGPFKKPLDRHQRKGVSRWSIKLILFPIFPNTKGVIFNPSLIHLHQRSIQKDTFAYVAPAAGKFWALGLENGIWLSFRVSFPFPLARWCTLWLRLFLVLFLSLCHTQPKPKATLNVHVCVSVIMRGYPKGTVWKSSTFPVDYPPIFTH